MVAETQNQQPLKKIKVEDRISLLPDCLIIEILSCLDSTKQAIRTGSLSKRWQHLWNYVPTLVFRESECQISSFFQFVDETLRQFRQTKLDKFKLILRSLFGFESQVKSLIHYAIRCNVEALDLDLKNRVSVLDEFFYTASSFTHLKLNCLGFNPSTPTTWGKIKSLHISNAILDEDLIRNILSGSPLLETLKLDSCYGICRLDITSKNVKKLVLSNFFGKVNFEFVEFNDTISINAPNLLSITIKGDLGSSKLLLLNVSSLLKAKLDYKNDWHIDREAKEKMLKELLVSLRHVKETLSGLKPKGFIPPSNLKLPMNKAAFFDDDLVSSSD